MSNFERRDLIRILFAATVASPAHAAIFTSESSASLEAFCEAILPGSREARVTYYIGLVLQYGPEKSLQSFREGLTELGTFHRLDPAAATALLQRISANEGKPQSTLDRFFEQVKALTIEAYCHSEVGQRYFGGPGEMRVSFEGCTHPEHQR